MFIIINWLILGHVISNESEVSGARFVQRVFLIKAVVC
jgi:hypothetical protein